MKKDIAVTSHLYEHHVLTPNRPQGAVIKAARNSKPQISSKGAAENLTTLRQSAKDSANRHPSQLTAEQLDIVQAPKGDLFVVVGELLYSPDSSDGAPKSNTCTPDNSDGEQQEEEGPSVWASHLVCIKARSGRCNLLALVSKEEGTSWYFLSLPQSMNDWVAYYQEFTGCPDELQDSQHKRRRAAWKHRITAFCALFLGSDNRQVGDKTSAVRSGEEVSVPKTSAEVGQNTSNVEPAEHARVFQLTSACSTRLIQTRDLRNTKLRRSRKHARHMAEISIPFTQTIWKLQTGQLTKKHIREISRCVVEGFLVDKPALPPFKHQAFILNCSILARNAAKRKMAVVWDNIVEDAFDVAWNTTCPHPSGREAWSSEVIVIDD
ncbi:hypothetical protein QBC32DRAFT_327065 [Pseudoneurospora amorphoporcata]|uniref:Uncharacterized protein n=1 Tax=Pseudoneurospora amorphoporcata TaxID=241081 RepID=A0AAN6NQL5_9PEZI|nr:hypothetical protein QBC32DRAFT_327065 [Pseudoneurospora amorphoporcata]